MIGIIEAISVLGIPLRAIKAFSLGTTDEVKSRPQNLDTGGLFQWRKTAVDVVMRGQSIGATAQAKHLLEDKNVYRFDPMVPEDLFALDRVTEDRLLSKAAHESRIIAPGFKAQFVGHEAEQYKPLKT